MRGRAQLIQDLRRDELVRAEFRPAVHDSMANGHRRRVNIVPEFRGESGKGVALRLVDTFARNQCVSIGRTDV